MLYLLQILFVAKFKPTNIVNGAAFSWYVFSFEFVTYQRLQRYQISCKNKHQVEK